MITKCPPSGGHVVTTSITYKGVISGYHQNQKSKLMCLALRDSKVLIFYFSILILLTSISDESHFTRALDFAGHVALVLGTTTSFFARQNFVLSAHKLTEHFAVPQGGDVDVGAAKNADGVALFFHKLKWNIFNANIFFVDGRGLGHSGFNGHSRFTLWLGSRAGCSTTGIISSVA